MEHAGETRATSSQAHRAERRRMSTSLQNLATDQPDHHHLRRSQPTIEPITLAHAATADLIDRQPTATKHSNGSNAGDPMVFVSSFFDRSSDPPDKQPQQQQQHQQQPALENGIVMKGNASSEHLSAVSLCALHRSVSNEIKYRHAGHNLSRFNRRATTTDILYELNERLIKANRSDGPHAINALEPTPHQATANETDNDDDDDDDDVGSDCALPTGWLIRKEEPREQLPCRYRTEPSPHMSMAR
uniref:Uncharacterized protein n=1 Tax=Anopheles albimanus TaxID=7167 RepID=A0A182FF87_ANOAL